MDPQHTSVRGHLVSLGLIAVASCGGEKRNASNAEAIDASDRKADTTDAVAPGEGNDAGAIDLADATALAADVAAPGEGNDAGAIDPADARADGNDGEIADGSNADVVALCCACGNAACCDHGCPNHP